MTLTKRKGQNPAAERVSKPLMDVALNGKCFLNPGAPHIWRKALGRRLEECIIKDVFHTQKDMYYGLRAQLNEGL